MKNWLTGGAAAVCLALCLTSCSDSEDEEKVYAVAPQWAGKITFTPSEDIRPGEKVKYAVTSLDRMSNESKPKKKSIKY